MKIFIPFLYLLIPAISLASPYENSIFKIDMASEWELYEEKDRERVFEVSFIDLKKSRSAQIAVTKQLPSEEIEYIRREVRKGHKLQITNNGGIILEEITFTKEGCEVDMYSYYEAKRNYSGLEYNVFCKIQYAAITFTEDGNSNDIEVIGKRMFSSFSIK